MRLASGEAEAHSIDLFLGGRVTLVQPRSGHRAGLDAALLQALVPADACGHAFDLGSGAGTVALSVAARAPGMHVTGVESSPALIDCALQSLQQPSNAGFAERIGFIQADLTAPRAGREASGLVDGSADWVLMNPPYDTEGGVRASPDPDRRSAHVAAPGALPQWLRTAAGLLKPSGSLGIIHRAAALADVLDALKGRFGDCRILPVHPKPDAPASRILTRAVRGSGASLRLLPALVLHHEDGSWTAEADSVLRGQRHLDL